MQRSKSAGNGSTVQARAVQYLHKEPCTGAVSERRLGAHQRAQEYLITVLAATLVIKGSITLGMMLAITYIVGQLNSPIQQFINFIRQVQDAKISLERLGEIHNKPNEDTSQGQLISNIQPNIGFDFQKVSFRYIGTSDLVLKDLTLTIPPNKTTAIVGTSGSGKIRS